MDRATDESLHVTPSSDGIRRRKPLLRPPVRRNTLAPRQLAPYVAAVVVLLVARPTAASLAIGLLLVGLGQVLRLWAAGYLRKTAELTVSGPYAFLRHPLYAGALLMGSGGLVMAGPETASVALPVGLVFFFGYYLPYKERVEARRLERIYGDVFRTYRSDVPALWPRLRPWSPPGGPDRPARPRWNLSRVIENDEQSVAVWSALTAFVIALREAL